MMMKTFYNRRNEITCNQGCLMWVNRVIVPHGLRQDVLLELHETLAGIVRTETLARSYIW